MKKVLVYALAAMFFLPALDSESKPVAESKNKTEVAADAAGKKKPKKNATKKGKPKKRYVYRPGARQN